MSVGAVAMAAPAPALGTGFGEATDFSTNKASFDRGDLQSMEVIFYDDNKGLKRVGIEVDTLKTPNPFPAMQTGCVPPSGWGK